MSARLLPEVQPPTPELADYEIAKIHEGLNTLKLFNDKLWMQQGLIINEVWATLQKQLNRDVQTDNHSIKKFFEYYLTVASIVDGIGALIPSPLQAAFAISALILGSAAKILSLSGSGSSIIGGGDVSGSMGSHATLNNTQYYSLQRLLDYLIDNTNDARDYIFTYNDRSGTIRDLLKADFTTGTYFDNWLHLAARMFKRKLVFPEIINNQFLDLYFIEDGVDGRHIEHGHVYQPCAAPSAAGTQRERAFDKSNVGKGVRIFGNDEIMHFHPEYGWREAFGTSDTDLSGSYINAINTFVGSFPSAYIYPWAITDKSIYSQRWYIIEGFEKLQDDKNKPQYALCNGEFLNWLFIDDGAGVITNPNGVAFRYEVMRSKMMGFSDDVYLHAQQISEDILNLPSDTHYYSTSADYRYGPRDSSALNKLYHVYTGDLMLKHA